MNITISTLNIYFKPDLGENFMSVAQQIIDAVNAAKQANLDAIDRVSVDVAELKRLANAGQQITPEQLEGILASLGQIKTAADALDPLANFPGEVPPPPPPPVE